MATGTHFDGAFGELKRILQKYEKRLAVTADSSANYSLDLRKRDARGRPVFFGAVQPRKNYVSFHLMPVYMYPDLLEAVSPELRRRMQGKSCFNFKAPDRALFRELAGLTARSVERLKQEGWL